MYNFELESFQHFLPFCLFLKCWWRNCSISCIPLTAAETFLPSVTCFSLLKSPTTQSKTQFPISSHECLKMPRIRLEWASEGTLSILTFTVSFLLSRDWTHWCSVCFSYPAQQQDNSSPFPPPSSVHPSILKLDSPPHPHPSHMKTSIYTTGYCTLPLSRRTALIHHTLRCTPTTPIHLSIS